MNRLMFKNWLLISLLVFLPWHGVISVFLPAQFLFWKELVLLLLLVVIFDLKYLIQWFEKPSKVFQLPEIWAFLFLVWLLILVGLNGFDYYSIVAARYLGTGFFVFLIFSFYFSDATVSIKKNKRVFNYFIYACVLTVLFGAWAKFFGGFEVLKQFYSQTISSWVPGQTIPIFHETGGFVRMQGASSGPIEFSHLLVGALFVLLFIKPFLPTFSKKAWFDWSLFLILLFGIVQSFSRSAVLASLILLGIWGWQHWKCKMSKKTIIILTTIVFVLLGSFACYQKEFLYKNIVQRVGTSDHFTRPIEVLKIGLKSPFLGSLGQIGPAGRMRNLKEKNDDRAPIAENVLVDYFAQMGILGLIFSLGFFITLFFQIPQKWRGFPVVVFIMGMLASIFDMTPISIVFFLFLAFCAHPKNQK